MTDYIGGEIAGIATIRGEVISGQDMVEELIDITVKLDGLSTFNSPWFRQLRGPDTDHVNSVAANLNPVASAGVETMLMLWQIQQGITSTQPKMLLMLNDMSLPWGGLFDVNANWGRPHSGHRRGDSVDINRQVFDVDASIMISLPTNQRANVSRVCTAAGGKFYKANVDPNWHCQF